MSLTPPGAPLHDPDPLVAAIHAAPQRLVMAFAGAGAQALARLHATAGSSRTVLEARDLYAPRALAEWVGFTPEHVTTRRVAAAMAERAWRRARRLTAPPKSKGAPRGATSATEPGLAAAAGEAGARAAVADVAGAGELARTGAATPVFGLGVTAAIATDRPKRGEHRVLVAVRDGFGTAHYALTLAKGARGRAGEEAVVEQLILRAVADACGVLSAPEPALLEGETLQVEFDPTPLLAAFDAGERGLVVAREDGTLVRTLRSALRGGPRASAHGAAAGGGAPAGSAHVETVAQAGSAEAAPTPVILSGAFNPVHEGHLELARVAAERVGGAARPVFELPLVNADKSPIDVFQGRRRAQQFVGRAPLVLTREPLFVGKAALLPGSVFVIGADTAQRIVETRFYDGDPARVRAALKAVRGHRCRFLVAARRIGGAALTAPDIGAPAGQGVGGAVLTLADIAVPEGFEPLFEAIPEAAFRRDVSSTVIRARWGKGR